MLLSNYDFVVKHKTGISYTNADRLSHAYKPTISEHMCTLILLKLELNQTEVENLDPAINIMELSIMVEPDNTAPDTNAFIGPQKFLLKSSLYNACYQTIPLDCYSCIACYGCNAFFHLGCIKLKYTPLTYFDYSTCRTMLQTHGIH